MLRDTAASCSTAESLEKNMHALLAAAAPPSGKAASCLSQGRTLQRCRTLRRADKHCTLQETLDWRSSRVPL